MNIYNKVNPFIDYTVIKLVIFDVDGTLYNQKKMRIYMFLEILIFLILNPRKYNQIKILQDFRKQREIRSDEDCSNLRELQYLWVSENLGVKSSVVEKIIEDWIFTRPLKYLIKCRKKGAVKLFEKLKKHGIKTAVYSDYPAEKKMETLKLSVDLIVSSTDRNIDKFKPDPKGALYILKQLNNGETENCIFIGDRFEKDGICSENAKIKSLII